MTQPLEALERFEDDCARILSCLVEKLGSLSPNSRRRFSTALNRDQVMSKMWLLKELGSRVELNGTTVHILGGWFGVLPLLWSLIMRPANCRMISYDVDPGAHAIGEEVIGSLLESLVFQYTDMCALDYAMIRQEKASVVVNTVCEHLADLGTWYKLIEPGQLLVLQTNNNRSCREHLSPVDSLEEFEAQCPLRRVLFEGELALERFTRFMRIGFR